MKIIRHRLLSSLFSVMVLSGLAVAGLLGSAGPARAWGFGAAWFGPGYSGAPWGQPGFMGPAGQMGPGMPAWLPPAPILEGVTEALPPRPLMPPQLRWGYTRPGSPSDRVEDGKVVFMALDEQGKKGVGATVYFAVLELIHPDDGDAWGSGYKDFNSSFVAGVDVNGAASPALDTKSRFLYLYQVVNDRGTEFAIRNSSVKLICACAITSWGHFASVGFATEAGGDKGAAVIRPVSSSLPAVLDAPPDKAYRNPAPPIPTKMPLRAIGTDKAADGAVAKPAAGAAEKMPDAARNPDSVMLLGVPEFNYPASLRVSWADDNVVKKGERGSLFGFTSDIPPTLEGVRVVGKQVAAGGVVPAGAEVGAAPILLAEGLVPTPIVERCLNPQVADLSLMGGLPPVGGGARGGIAGAGFLLARPPFITAEGGGGGGGGGKSGAM